MTPPYNCSIPRTIFPLSHLILNLPKMRLYHILIALGAVSAPAHAKPTTSETLDILDISPLPPCIVGKNCPHLATHTINTSPAILLQHPRTQNPSHQHDLREILLQRTKRKLGAQSGEM